MSEQQPELMSEHDVPCPGCGRPMRSNGYTMYCETAGCVFNFFKPVVDHLQVTILPSVLKASEVERVYREGFEAFRRGLQFHECPYAKSGADVPDDDYQRGVEWRRGWNDAALGSEARP